MSQRPLLTNHSGYSSINNITPPPEDDKEQEKEEEDEDEEDEPTTEFAETGPREYTRRHKLTLFLVFMLLIFERIGFYSLDWHLNWRMVTGIPAKENKLLDVLVIFAIRAGGLFLFPVLGAWFGECLFGTHTTAVFGTVLEITGASLLTVSMWTTPEDSLTTTDIAGFVLITLGLVLTRSNYLMLAASQIPERQLVEKRFFQWYIFAMNIAKVLALVLCTWKPLTTQSVSWPGSIFITLILLLVVRVVSNDQLNYTSRKGFRKLLECFSCSPSQPDDNLSALRKHMITIILFIAMQFPYFLVDGTMRSTGFTPVTWFIVEPLILIPVVLIHSLIIAPIQRRCSLPTMNSTKSVALGLALATVSCILAAIAWGSLANGASEHTEDLGTFLGSLIPQYLVLGVSAALCQIKVLEFVYMETPKHLKTQMIGLYLTVVGMGYSVALAPVYFLVLTFLEGKLITHVWVYCGIAGVNLMLGVVPFLLFFRGYVYRRARGHSVSAAIDARRREPVFGGSAMEDWDELEEDDDCCCPCGFGNSSS